MVGYFTNTARRLKNDIPKEQEKRILWKSSVKEPVMAIREKCINVIACRVSEHNLQGSMRISMELAARAESDVDTWKGWDADGNPIEHVEAPRPKAKVAQSKFPPVKRVLYINTYAMMEHLAATMNFYAEHLEPMKERSKSVFDGTDALDGLPVLYAEAPMNVMLIDADKIRQSIVDNEVDVLVINSFEEATMSGYDKKKLAMMLRAWQREFNLTVIIYTTEVRKGMRTGVTTRGPIGYLVGHSGTFWFINDDRSEIYPYVEKTEIKQSDDEFRTQNNYKRGETRPEPTTTVREPWQRTLDLLAKGDKRTWEEEKELSPFTCAAMEERMTPEQKREMGVKV